MGGGGVHLLRLISEERSKRAELEEAEPNGTERGRCLRPPADPAPTTTRQLHRPDAAAPGWTGASPFNEALSDLSRVWASTRRENRFAASFVAR